MSRQHCNPEENLAMQAHVGSQHETLNRQLKNWGILAQVYRHDIVAHGTVFHACAVVTQLSITNREPLFKVEYGDLLNYIVTTPCNTSNTLFPTITYVTPKTTRVDIGLDEKPFQHACL